MKQYKNYYLTEEGRVFNHRLKELKPILKKESGYYQVALYTEKREIWLLHRLMATVFLDNPENKPCVGHWDCDRSNNSIDNLYWCTYSENNSHPTTLARKSESLKGKPGWNKGGHLTEKWKNKIASSNSIPIIQYDDNGFEKEWPGINVASRELGYNAGNISACCRGERQTHKGYKWRFK